MCYVWFSIVLTAETQTNAPWHTPLFSVGREHPKKKAEGRIERRNDDGSLPKPTSDRRQRAGKSSPARPNAEKQA